MSNFVEEDFWQLGEYRLQSRLLLGTGKYKSLDLAYDAVLASGAEIITVAVRRLQNMFAGEKSFTEIFDPKKFIYLPNTAGCYTANEAVRLLRLAREAGAGALVKLEIIGDKNNLFPDMEETLQAAKILAKEGFSVMAYSSDDPVFAQKLEDAGCVAVMPLAAPIGSGLGIQNPRALSYIVERLKIPVLVDAGIGTASDAVLAMELGCSAVLLNTAVAEAEDPVKMAISMRYAVMSGRLALLSGRMTKRALASPSSPELNFSAQT